MSEEYTEQKLKEIQDELMNNIDKEQEDEDEVEAKSDQLSASLMINRIVKAEINGQTFTLKFNVVNSSKRVGSKVIPIKVIILIAANDAKFKLLGKKYVPFTANAEIVDSLSMQENLRGVVDAFIRHITGLVKPQEVND